MRKLALRALIGTALTSLAIISTPALAATSPPGHVCATYQGMTGDTNQATALPNDNVGRESRTFNIDMLGDINDSTAIGGAAAHSVATTTSLFDGSSDTR